MIKYRKKPVIIEAMQLTDDTALFQLLHWIDDNGAKVKEWCWDDDEKYYIIETLEGNMKAEEGDYIIKGVKGEFYPCKPDIFELTYEEIGDDDY